MELNPMLRTCEKGPIPVMVIQQTRYELNCDFVRTVFRVVRTIHERNIAIADTAFSLISRQSFREQISTGGTHAE
jgi:hypothetical protein